MNLLGSMAGEQVCPYGEVSNVGAPYKDAYNKFEITPEGIARRAKATIDFWKGMGIFVICLILDVKPIRSPMRKAFEQLI